MKTTSWRGRAVFRAGLAGWLWISPVAAEAATFTDANWSSLNPGIPGANGPVTAAVVDDAGNLYIAGWFSMVADVLANGVAKWDGTNWSALGSGLSYGADTGEPPVCALAVSGGNLYAGGNFALTQGGYLSESSVAMWNGSTWTSIASGFVHNQSGWWEPATVRALAVSGTNLYAGGDFTWPGNCIAKWDGNRWTTLGSGMGSSYGGYISVNALAVCGTNLCAGGNFDTAGGTHAYNIAMWNGSSWSALPWGLNSGVAALAVSGSDLYAGGAFTYAEGGSSLRYIAKWNGTNWASLGQGMGGGWPAYAAVNALAVSGGDVYAAGNFTRATNNSGVTITANHIAKWDSHSWTALGSGIGGVYDFAQIWALSVSGTNLYIGGGFTSAGGAAALNIGRWEGGTWSAMGSGMHGTVLAAAVQGSNAYVGGNFTITPGGAANYIARWTGGAWSPLGSGLNSSVSALAVSGSDLYAGGGFTLAGGLPANHIAKWNGSGWSALGSGLDGWASALAVSGADLYAGGYFTNAGGIAAKGIAKWNGTTWTNLGSGLEGHISALAISGSDVYAGGDFTNAGGIPVKSIAKWNGTNWSALGSGIGTYYGEVLALAVFGNDLYAGGIFVAAGGAPATNIAKWNGTSWSAVAGGLGGGDPNAIVRALAVSGSYLYAAGYFSTAGGIAATNIARWDGCNWSALGSGLPGAMGASDDNGDVYALAVSGADLFAGGDFMVAGNRLSPFIARAYLLPLPELSTIRSGPEVRVSWPSADTADFTLEQTPMLDSPTTWTTNTATITDDGTSKSVNLSPTKGAQFFRLRRP